MWNFNELFIPWNDADRAVTDVNTDRSEMKGLTNQGGGSPDNKKEEMVNLASLIGHDVTTDDVCH